VNFADDDGGCQSELAGDGRWTAADEVTTSSDRRPRRRPAAAAAAAGQPTIVRRSVPGIA